MLDRAPPKKLAPKVCKPGTEPGVAGYTRDEGAKCFEGPMPPERTCRNPISTGFASGSKYSNFENRTE